MKYDGVEEEKREKEYDNFLLINNPKIKKRL
jgi:hypothetical protein